MAHPRMYDDDDPVLVDLRKVCLAFPGAEEHESHGRPTFRTKKIFAVYGGGEKGTGETLTRPRSVIFRPDEEEIRLLLRDSRFFVPAYYGPYGWVGLDLSSDPVDWAEVADLVETSYRNTAPRTLIRRLDSSSDGHTPP